MPARLPAYCSGCGPAPAAPYLHRGEPACEDCIEFALDAGLSMDQVFLFLYMLRRVGFDPASLD
jgi:hypothetical protein